MKNKSAFTLIELLVVIAIIAILAALAMPGLTAWLERAKSTADTNNLKQLGAMFQRYLDEHEDQMPDKAAGQAGSWPQQIHKMVPDYKIFLSPFDKRAPADGSNAPISYGINDNNMGKNTSVFSAPSELIMMAPVASPGGAGTPKFTGLASQNLTVTPTSTRGIYRNSTYINVLFADTHALPMNYKLEFTDQSSTKGKKHWIPEFVEAQ